MLAREAGGTEEGREGRTLVLALHLALTLCAPRQQIERRRPAAARAVDAGRARWSLAIAGVGAVGATLTMPRPAATLDVEPARRAVEGGAKGAHLALEHPPHGLVGSAARHQVVDVHGGGALPDAVAAVLGLEQLARDPSELTEDGGGRTGQREALASGQDGEDKQARRGGRSRLELRHELGPLHRRDAAVDPKDPHAAGGSGGTLHRVKHALVVREEEQLPPRALRQLLQAVLGRARRLRRRERYAH